MWHTSVPDRDTQRAHLRVAEDEKRKVVYELNERAHQVTVSGYQSIKTARTADVYVMGEREECMFVLTICALLVGVSGGEAQGQV